MRIDPETRLGALCRSVGTLAAIVAPIALFVWGLWRFYGVVVSWGSP